MGGSMSGVRWHKKEVVEGLLTLDTTRLRRLMLLSSTVTERTGVLRWRWGDRLTRVMGYAIVVREQSGELRLSFRDSATDADVASTIPLTSTPCHLGGVRWWFSCPMLSVGVPCGRRVRKLYLIGSEFGCRRCHDLTYESRQTSDKRVYATLRSYPDLSLYEAHEGMTLSEARFAFKLFVIADKRRERNIARADR